MLCSLRSRVRLQSPTPPHSGDSVRFQLCPLTQGLGQSAGCVAGQQAVGSCGVALWWAGGPLEGAGPVLGFASL